jgi:hypothetical protein
MFVAYDFCSYWKLYIGLYRDYSSFSAVPQRMLHPRHDMSGHLTDLSVVAAVAKRSYSLLFLTCAFSGPLS